MTASVLTRNDAAYRAGSAVVRTLSASDPLAAVVLAGVVAEFAESHHPGRFADGGVENQVLQIGRALPGRPAERRAVGPKRVLHVATQVRGIGGHTRTMANWIRADSTRTHSVVITAQPPGVEIPCRLSDGVVSAGGAVHRLDHRRPHTERAKELRRLAGDADAVILHHYGHDVIPVLAFAVSGGPPVGLVNHADHLYWLGGSVADLVIHQRHVSRTLDERRFVCRGEVLPIPLERAVSATEPRSALRQRLGLPLDCRVLVCVGRASKFTPTREHNFYRAAAAVLDQNPEAVIAVVGVDHGQATAHAGGQLHERLLLLGERPSASDYLHAADGYVEGFPFGSQTALLEAAAAGLPVVRAVAPPIPLLASDDEAINPYVDTPSDEAGYVAAAGRIIRCEDQQLGRRLSETVTECHTGTGWLTRLNDIYATLASLPHDPLPLPTTEACDSPLDQRLGEWQESTTLEPAWAEPPEQVHRLARSASYALRGVGCHASAARVLWVACRRSGWRTATATSAMKLIPHKLLSLVSR